MFTDLLAKLDRARAAVAVADQACRELGTLAPDEVLRGALAGLSDAQLEAVDRMASGRPGEALGRATTDSRSRGRPPAPPSPALAPTGREREARNCLRCGKSFTPHPKAAVRAKFCGAKCRAAAAVERKRGKADADWRAKTAELRAQHAAEGYVAPNGTTAEE